MDTCTWRKEEKEGGRSGSLLNGMTAELDWEGQRGVEVRLVERHTRRKSRGRQEVSNQLPTKHGATGSLSEREGSAGMSCYERGHARSHEECLSNDMAKATFET